MEIVNTGLLSLFDPHQIIKELLNGYAVPALVAYGLLSLVATFLLFKYGQSKIALLIAWIAGVYVLRFRFRFHFHFHFRKSDNPHYLPFHRALMRFATSRSHPGTGHSMKPNRFHPYQK